MARKQSMDEKAESWRHQAKMEPPSKRVKVSLKMINVKLDDFDGVEEEEDGSVWLDLDEIDAQNSSGSTRYRTAKTMEADEEEAWYKLPSDDRPKPTDDSKQTSDGSTRPSSVLRQAYWGEEVPSACDQASVPLDSSQVSYCVMNDGTNPLITIRAKRNLETATKAKGDISGTKPASDAEVQSNRVLDLDKLRNYFQLTEPETGEASGGSKPPAHKFYLSLLDPSMPRLTNCMNYFRMRYAVYVLPRPRVPYTSRSAMMNSSSSTSWRRRPPGVVPPMASGESTTTKDDRKGPLLHIGEMHLYTTFTKDGLYFSDWLNRWGSLPTTKKPPPPSAGKNLVHYENISFFINQASLTWEEKAIIKVSDSDIEQLSMAFRYFLKQLNSLNVNTRMASTAAPERANYASTYLLEQLKYPMYKDRFTNPDGLCEQFQRNQGDMYIRYEALFAGRLHELDLDSSNKLAKDHQAKPVLLTKDSFLAGLHQMKNQDEAKSAEA